MYITDQERKGNTHFKTKLIFKQIWNMDERRLDTEKKMGLCILHNFILLLKEYRLVILKWNVSLIFTLGKTTK